MIAAPTMMRAAVGSKSLALVSSRAWLRLSSLVTIHLIKEAALEIIRQLSGPSKFTGTLLLPITLSDFRVLLNVPDA